MHVNHFIVSFIICSNYGSELKYKVAGIISNLAVPDNLRNDVMDASDVVVGLSSVVSAHASDLSLETRSMAATALRNLAVTSRGQQIVGSTSQAVRGVSQLLTDAYAVLTEQVNNINNNEAEANAQPEDASAQIAAIAKTNAAARNAVLKAVAALENLSAFEENRVLIVDSSEHTISTLCLLLMSVDSNKESQSILSHAVGKYAMLVWSVNIILLPSTYNI